MKKSSGFNIDFEHLVIQVHPPPDCLQCISLIKHINLYHIFWSQLAQEIGYL